MNEFRFSPRPNRAAEIAWMSWGDDAFARAAKEDKPILLSISAVWCHWCHVMDETSYSDPAVIETINRRFVPVRVDNDRRPDVNARYNMGGWPTTAFLTPDGATLTGATYLPPQQMVRALDQIADFYVEQKGEIAERVVTSREDDTLAPSRGTPFSAAMVDRLVEVLAQAYDQEYGGFGDAPKFPQPEVHEFLLSEWSVTGDQRLHDMVARTMLAMTRGGMYDHVEGGFFRYSTTRDWSVPHFEKMAEDHGGLLRVLAELVRLSPTEELRADLLSTVNYTRDVLYDTTTGLFAGSQDADEAYYELPLEERHKLASPYVDPTLYTHWSCGLAGAWCFAARALDDDALLERALKTLDTVHERLIDEDGLAYHYLADGRPHVRGLLVDQVAYVRALVDAHEISGQPRMLERARGLAGRVIERFAGDGGFCDRLPDQALGRLALPDRPIVENSLFADVLLRLAALTNEARYRENAERVLHLYAVTYLGAGPFAAPYVRALRRFISPEFTVRIVGEPAETSGFREAASRLPSALSVVATIPPNDAPRFDLPSQPHPAAYPCAGTVCGAPVQDPAGLRAGYDALVATL